MAWIAMLLASRIFLVEVQVPQDETIKVEARNAAQDSHIKMRTRLKEASNVSFPRNPFLSMNLPRKEPGTLVVLSEPPGDINHCKLRITKSFI